MKSKQKTGQNVGKPLSSPQSSDDELQSNPNYQYSPLLATNRFGLQFQPVAS